MLGGELLPEHLTFMDFNTRKSEKPRQIHGFREFPEFML